MGQVTGQHVSGDALRQNQQHSSQNSCPEESSGVPQICTSPVQASSDGGSAPGQRHNFKRSPCMLQILQMIATHIPHPCSHPCSSLEPDSNAAILACLALYRDNRDLETVCYIGRAT